MVGHAVGDALGVPVEAMKREVLEENPITDMIGFGVYNYPPGTWSDDTSMSLAALDSLADGKIDFDKIMKNFGKWLMEGEYTPDGEAFDVGKTCVRAIIDYNTNGTKATESGGKAEYANGNGSLMRIHPFSLAAIYENKSHYDTDSFIAAASSLTHAHERSILGCQIYTAVLQSLIEAPKIVSVTQALKRSAQKYASSQEFNSYARLLAPDFSRLPSSEIKSSGYVVDTLEAAIWCLLTTSEYAECVLKAVNLGDDTDTVAAIAGGLAGALYGYAAIPRKWRDTLIRREYIESICRRASTAFARTQT